MKAIVVTWCYALNCMPLCCDSWSTLLLLNFWPKINIDTLNCGVIVQSLSQVQLHVTPWAATCQAFLHGLPKCAQTHVHWINDAIQLFHTLALPSLLALNLSQHQGLFHWVSSYYQRPKYWSFGFSISPSNEYSVLISFKINWFDLFAV